MLFIAESHATHNCLNTILKNMENLTYNTKQTSNWIFLLNDTSRQLTTKLKASTVASFGNGDVF